MSTQTDKRCTSLTRRSFLLSLAGAAGSVCFVSGCQRFVTAVPGSQPWSEWLLDAYNRESVSRLGTAYRADHPEESSAEVLAGSIERALAEAGNPGKAADPAGHAVILQQRVRDEYARGEIVRLSGWIVSITEARLYALVSLDSAASV
jgi:hypothetical protein